MTNERLSTVSWGIDQLNNHDSGSGIFQELANILAQKHICHNLMPTSMPSSGGDKGIDARSFVTYQPVLQIEKQITWNTAETDIKSIIVAISIRKDVKEKIKEDVENIVKQHNIEKIYFLTNQKISPEKTKLELESELTKLHKVEITIFDKSFFMQHLANDDYPLAIDYLGCPSALNPLKEKIELKKLELEEKGLSSTDATRITEIQLELRYHNTPRCSRQITAELILDLYGLMEDTNEFNILTQEIMAKTIDNKAQNIFQKTLADIFYKYFLCLFGSTKEMPEKKDLGRIQEIILRFGEYREHIISNRLRNAYGDIVTWCMFLKPWLLGTQYYEDVWQKTLDILNTIDRTELGTNSLAYLDFALLRMNAFSIQEEFNLVCDALISEGHKFHEKYKGFPFFDFSQVAKFYTSFSMMVSSIVPEKADDLNEISEKFEDLVAERHKDFSKTNLLKERGLQYIDKGDLYYGMALLDEAKYQWLHPEAFYACFLTTSFLAMKYEELNYIDAARWELWSMIFLVLNDAKIQDFDILYRLLRSATNLALNSGHPKEGTMMMQLLLGTPSKLQDGATVENYMSNIALILNSLRENNIEMHDQLFDLVKTHETIKLYQEVALLSDEEFEKAIQGDAEETKQVARDLRNDVKKYPATLKNFKLADEPCCSISTKWTYVIDDQTIQFEIKPQNKNDEPLRFLIASILQRYFVICDDIIRYLTPYSCSITINIVSKLPQQFAVQENVKFYQDRKAITSIYVLHDDEVIKGLKKTDNSYFTIFSLQLLLMVLRTCTFSSIEGVSKMLTPEQNENILFNYYQIMPPYILLTHETQPIFQEARGVL